MVAGLRDASASLLCDVLDVQMEVRVHALQIA